MLILLHIDDSHVIAHLRDLVDLVNILRCRHRHLNYDHVKEMRLLVGGLMMMTSKNQHSRETFFLNLFKL